MRIALIAALAYATLFQTPPLSAQTESPALLAQNTTPNAASTAQGDSDQTQVADKDMPQKPDASKSRFNIPIKTTGGTQVWTDHAFRHGYRIQQHALTGHFRLLDSSNVRRGWGTEQQCLNTLDDIIPKPATPSAPQHVAVLLHGLMRTAHSMKPLEAELKKIDVDHSIRFSYASTQFSIANHSSALRKILEDQPANTQFSFAGHSMGNIVVRHLVGELQRDKDPKNILPRCRSMVMLGPPNQGASIARRLAPTKLYGLVTGKGGLELGPEWEDFVKQLATPPFPFAIVAGDVSANTIQNPLVDGDGDFVVSLDEAKLDGSEEFHTLPVLHSFLMSDEKAMKLTTEFISKY